MAIITFIACERSEKVEPVIQNNPTAALRGYDPPVDASCGDTSGYVFVDIPEEIASSEDNSANLDCAVVTMPYYYNQVEYSGTVFAKLDGAGRIASLGFSGEMAGRLGITASYLEGENGAPFIANGPFSDCYGICNDRYNQGQGRGGCRLACWVDLIYILVCTGCN